MLKPYREREREYFPSISICFGRKTSRMKKRQARTILLEMEPCLATPCKNIRDENRKGLISIYTANSLFPTVSIAIDLSRVGAWVPGVCQSRKGYLNPARHATLARDSIIWLGIRDRSREFSGRLQCWGCFPIQGSYCMNFWLWLLNRLGPCVRLRTTVDWFLNLPSVLPVVIPPWHPRAISFSWSDRRSSLSKSLPLLCSIG